tara:strand:- start:2019 stop:2270 length:252 start_codon:yes stop_codon:yes gene_type:complete
MKVDNTNHSSKTLKQMQDKLAQCLAFEKKYGKTTRTTAMIKWCTSEQYRKNVKAFNIATANTMRAMGPYKWAEVVSKKGNYIL